MSTSSSPTTSVPNEGVPIEIPDSDHSSSNKKQHYPVMQLLAPLVVVSAVSVALGLLPYLRVRHYLVRHGRVLERVDDGNRRLAEYIRSRDVNTTAYRMQQHKSQSDVHLRLEQIEDKYQRLETVSREQATALDSIRNQLEEANARGRELEHMLGGVGRQMGSTLAQLATFIEETERMSGQQDRGQYSERLRALALLLQSWRERATGPRRDSNTTSESS